METHQTRWAALAALCLLLISWGCGPRNLAAPVPGEQATPYVRLATYNAIIAEANLAAVKVVRSAADVQLLPPDITRQIFDWQERVAITSKALAVALSDSAVDLRSQEITDLVLQLAAPPAFEAWLPDATGEQQKLLVASLRGLAATIAIVIREFGRREGVSVLVDPRHPAQANVDAWYASNQSEVALGTPPRPGRFMEFSRLRLIALGYRSAFGR